VLVGSVPWNHVPIKNPLVYALAPLHMPVLNWVITMGVLAGTTSVALSSLLGQSRIFYVMARDKMLPPSVAYIHPRFKTPYVAILLAAVLGTLVVTGAVGAIASAAFYSTPELPADLTGTGALPQQTADAGSDWTLVASVGGNGV